MITTFIIFIVVLSVLVFFHEFGHFFVAKRAGLRVDEFGFGFPPRVVGFQKINGKWRVFFGPVRGKTPEASADMSATSRTSNGTDPQQGDTLYTINALPFGGFVKIKGEAGEGAEDKDSFASQKAFTRALVVCAGVFMNVVLAVVLIAGGFVIGFPQVVENNLSKYARVSDQHIAVMGVLPGSPAEQAGMKPGSRILMLDGRALVNAEEFRAQVTEFVDKNIQIVVEQDGAQQSVQLTPKVLEQTQKAGIGVAINDIATIKYPIWLAVPKAVQMSGEFMQTIVVSIGGLLKDALVGKAVTSDLTGPVGIAVLTGQAARMGFVYLLQFMAVLSLNLAVLNILPFPALDGGRLLFILLEKIFRKPVPRQIEGWAHGLGFALLMVFVLFVTYRDLGKYSGGIMDFFRNLI